MNPINIALLHYSCPPVVGGVEEVIRQQALLFKRYYQNVKVFAGDGGQFSPDFEVEINPLLGSRNKSILKAHQALREGNEEYVEQLAIKIYKYLKEALQGFDLLIAHNVLTMRYNLPLTFALFRLAQEDILPIISWNHDSPYFYEDHPDYLNTSPWTILRKFHRKIFYVVISESRRNQFAKLYSAKEHIYVIPNGVDPIAFFRLDPLTVRLIQAEKLFEADFILVQPSRLHPRKNIELSIRVTHALRELGIDARFLLTGAYDPHEPKTVEYYRKLVGLARELGISQQVIIIAEYKFKSGQKITADRIRIRDLYLIADALFLPSTQEGFGIPLLEAGMIKLPIICSNIPPFKEIGGHDVVFFNLNDSPETIARRILEFKQRLEPQRMFRRVMKEYTWDNIYTYKLYPLLLKILEEFRSWQSPTPGNNYIRT